MLSTYWEPKPRSRKSLEGNEEGDEGDEGDEGGEAVAQPTDPASPPSSQVNGFQPVRTPQKEDQQLDEEETLDPYMAWTLGGEMLPAELEPSAFPTSPTESVKPGDCNPDQQAPHGESDEMAIEEQLKKLEFLVCSRLVSFGVFTFQL